MEKPTSQSGRTAGDGLFTSARERRLWAWALLAVATIYSTLGLAGSLAALIGDRGLNAITFVLGSLLVLIAAIAFGLGDPSRRDTFVAVGVAAVYTLLFTRLTSPVERSHLIEYGVVALLIHAASTERRANGGRIGKPALTAIVATALVGVVDELIQLILPNRVFDPVDIAFNVFAALLAVASVVLLGRTRHKTRSD